jgi:hypothetical protein
VGKEHVGARQRPRVEDVGCPVGGDHRRYRPELLTPLDVIESLEVLGIAGVCEQAAMPQSARTELGAPLKPSHHEVALKRRGDLLGEVGRLLEAHPGALERARKLPVVPSSS